jgi:catechol 2,3-dioxygenase-like lactoylglutathione lyase family enzyme
MAHVRPERLAMKLNHLDIQVSDVPRAVALFEDLLGLRLESNRSSTAIAVLGDGEGFTLVLQRKKHEAERYPDGFHFGFIVPDPAEVRRFQERARALDLDVSDVIHNGRGVLAYWRTADGLLVEISWHAPRQQGERR